MPKRLIFVRHGETAHNALGKFISWRTNPPLSETGRKQATSTGKRLSQMQVDVIYHSDILRTTETASIIGKLINLAPVPTELLRERDLGIFDNHTLHEVQEKWPDHATRFFDHTDIYWKGHGGESLHEVHTRFASLLSHLDQHHPAQTVLLVTHSGYTHTVLRDHFHFFPTESFSESLPASITIVERVGDEYQLTLYNQTADE